MNSFKLKIFISLFFSSVCWPGFAQPNFDNDTPEWARIRAMNKKMCVLTKQTKLYAQIYEEISTNIGVHPDSITLSKLYYLPSGVPHPSGRASANQCWANFYTPKGVAECGVWFDKQGIIWRADCQEPVGKICTNGDCRPLFK